MIGFVYEWTNSINGKKYIGSHKGHENDGYIGSGLIFKKAIKKYGIENFKRQILYIGPDFKNEETKFLIEVNAANSSNYYNMKNQSLGGTFYGCQNGMFKKSHTNDTKHLMSEASKKSWTSERKIKWGNSIKGSNNPQFGKLDHCTALIKKSKENIGKTYDEIFGKQKSLEIRNQMSKNRLGKKHNLKLLKCPYCSTKGSGPNMSRFHFNKCPLNFENPINKLGKYSVLEPGYFETGSKYPRLSLACRGEKNGMFGKHKHKE